MIRSFAAATRTAISPRRRSVRFSRSSCRISLISRFDLVDEGRVRPHLRLREFAVALEHVAFSVPRLLPSPPVRPGARVLTRVRRGGAQRALRDPEVDVVERGLQRRHVQRVVYKGLVDAVDEPRGVCPVDPHVADLDAPIR